jgi:UDP-glucose 4-epimerase
LKQAAVLVTGGAGFIGSNLARELVRRGAGVRILDNLHSGYEQNVPPGALFVRGDVTDAAAVETLAESTDTIFHLAASVGNKRSIDNPVLDAMVNVIGTLNVLNAARKHGVPKVVISSSAGIFGELKTLPIREDHPAEPDTPYGASKLGAEKEGLAYAKLYGIAVVCLRYFNVYGPNQRFDAYGNVIPIFAFKMLAGESITVFGDGEQTRDFVNVHDVVQANLKAAGAVGVSGAFNIGSGTRITINELVTMLGSAIGHPAAVRLAPPRPGDVRDSLADIGAARRAYGYEPAVDMASGLKEYIDWARTAIAVPA